MDQLAAVYQKAIDDFEEMKRKKEEAMQHLRSILWGSEDEEDKENAGEHENATQADTGNVTQTKKRAKHLSVLQEDEGSTSVSKTVDDLETAGSSSRVSKRLETRSSAARVKKTTKVNEEENIVNTLGAVGGAPLTESSSAIELMPPPPPVPVIATVSDQSFARPQRAAKLICEKNLKEPQLNKKLRRPTDDETRIKLEHKQRASQMHETEVNNKSVSKTKSNISIAKEPSIAAIDQSVHSTVGDNELQKSQSVESADSSVNTLRKLRVRVKRERLSNVDGVDNAKAISAEKVQKETATTISESTITVAGNTTNDTTKTKKGQRKKKIAHKPIKVERLSDTDANKTNSAKDPPTRSGEQNNGASNLQTEPNATVCKEALETQQPLVEKTANKTKNSTNSHLFNETVTIVKADSIAASLITPCNATMISGGAPNDATYCITACLGSNPQATGGAAVACNDQTFDVASTSKHGTESQRSSEQSMVTARDTLRPNADSLLTEDESDQQTPVVKPTITSLKWNAENLSASKKLIFPTKSYKLPVREIFNPLVQSPLKKKVEAFENVAAVNKATRATRSKNAKGNSTAMKSSTKTSLTDKPITSSASRHLTPTQPASAAISLTKHFSASASKAIGPTKSNSADNLRVISSAKAPARSNSVEDFRRGIQLNTEERKKQRAERHRQAAQQREAKERERAERLAKAAKEREERRLKVQQQAEQKQRELQEIQRKLRQQEEIAAAETARQKERLDKIRQQNLAKAMPPPPEPINNYKFDMLHEDDSTDDEGKVTYKRPAPPNWSLSHVRGQALLAQEHMDTGAVDCFFSVQPITFDLKTIFPTINPRFLKRNSSAVWNTPPRYSELPKY